MTPGHKRVNDHLAHDAARILVAIVRRHIDYLRDEDVSCAPTHDVLRQCRDYGYGMLGLLAGYCEVTGVRCVDCLRLALELQEVIEEARGRLSTRCEVRSVALYRRRSRT